MVSDNPLEVFAIEVTMGAYTEDELPGAAALALQRHQVLQMDIKRLRELLDEQKGTIRALNDCLGGKGSTSTENIIGFCRMENLVREQIADWYDREGYLLDESDIAEAIRNRGK